MTKIEFSDRLNNLAMAKIEFGDRKDNLAMMARIKFGDD